MGLNREQVKKPHVGTVGVGGLYIGTAKVKKAYLGATRVYSAGNIVTYHVDAGTTYQEEVDEGESCLQPKTFTPSKSGWTFVGWRADAAASGDVLGSRVMGDEPVALYAVFAHTVTVTYYNTNATAVKETKQRYWNNGNAASPTFRIEQTTMSGWTARGWSAGAAANGGITYANNVAFTRDSDITLYGMYQQTITVTYYNGSTSASTAAGTRYYCPGSGSVVNPGFTLTQAASSGWTARGWSTSPAANGGISYANGATFTRDSNITLYGTYQQAVTLSYSGNGATGGSTAAQTGYRYWNSSGQSLNATFTLQANGFSRTGYTWAKWALGSAGGTQYSAGTSLQISASVTMYAVWISTVSNFAYTGGTQRWTAPISGTYRLQAYGAQGGSGFQSVGAGGYGGYAVGDVYLAAGTVLYIVIGGAGSPAVSIGSNASGGYNGGGMSSKIVGDCGGGGGGGCTHIGTFNATLAAHGSASGLYVVAGGGGGGFYHTENITGVGGSGGGAAGGPGTGGLSGASVGSGGTQSSGNGFGIGGTRTESWMNAAAGGGGGYYGGYAGGGAAAGGGGSGYVGGVSGGTMQNGVNAGNGKAAITFISA